MSWPSSLDNTMNLLHFKTHPDANNVDRIAYDPETSTLYVQFKPGGAAYSYDAVDRAHYDYLTVCRLAYADYQIAVDKGHPLPELPRMPHDIANVKPNSEASYIARVIIGDRKNPTHKTTSLTADEAAAIFPTTPTQP